MTPTRLRLNPDRIYLFERDPSGLEVLQVGTFRSLGAESVILRGPIVRLLWRLRNGAMTDASFRRLWFSKLGRSREAHALLDSIFEQGLVKFECAARITS